MASSTQAPSQGGSRVLIVSPNRPVKVTVAAGRKNQFAGEDDTVATESRRRRRHCSITVASL
ncbi:hypothetical protein LXL04_001686 [Taraxacum kok-saghyz]